MADRVPARLTVAEGRRFGLTVGIAFAVFAAIARWRGHQTVAVALGTLGAAFIAGGLVAPTWLGPVERAWMAMAHAISRVTTPIVMTAMYLIVFAPLGLLRRTISRNPLVHEPVDQSYWRTRPASARRTPSLKRQF